MTDATPAPETVGVLGGTFDPVHVGHLCIAVEARRLLGLARTLLLPTAVPPHKPRGVLSATHDRETMLQLATRDLEGVEISTLELASNRVSYTIDTLRKLRDGVPACSPVFILGMDSLVQITSWRHWREMLREFDLAVIERSGNGEARTDDLVPEVAVRLVRVDRGLPPETFSPGRGGRVFRLPMTPIPVSSSEVRARVRDGRPIDELVPSAVARYIRHTGLYRGEDKH